MNKAELIEALADRLGDRKTATAALDAVLAEIQASVAKGDKVAITGFGSFEKRERGARTARNPRTGEPVKVKKTSVPAFKPGTGFKEMVASGRVPKATGAKKTAGGTRTATKAPARSAASKATKASGGTRTAAAKKTAAKKTTTATKSTAAKSTAARSAAKKAPAKTTKATKATAKKTTAKATKTTAKKAPAKKTARR
ncbi:HU family DNA-binding protein [Plantactinospora sp. KBS50]|uniref:HU family DNA-binding protein n=1 Tax=Plantactinospora sp. KBS50 TaxID=2024580 RepID=UPI0018E01EE9